MGHLYLPKGGSENDKMITYIVFDEPIGRRDRATCQRLPILHLLHLLRLRGVLPSPSLTMVDFLVYTTELFLNRQGLASLCRTRSTTFTAFNYGRPVASLDYCLVIGVHDRCKVWHGEELMLSVIALHKLTVQRCR